MSIIGITGNSGTGKSAFTQILSKKINAKIIDADEVVRKSSEPGEKYYNEIVEKFGEEILNNNKINRKKLAQIIYNDETKRQMLNSLTQKYIVESIKNEVNKHKTENIVMDVPLLFESKLNKLCDITVSLIAKKETKIKRICERDDIEKDIAIQRLSIQKPDEFYCKNSNYVIVNNSANLEQEVNRFIEIMQKPNFLNDKIVMIRDNNIQYIQFRKLLEYENIKHCFTLRPIDVGNNKIYQEKKEKIDNTYKKICESLDINFEEIVKPYQTHTDIIKKVEKEKGIYLKKFWDTDGLMTNQKGKVLSLSFADCIAIYIFDKKKNVISLVHSGWVGTTKKIIKNAIRKMKKEYNCNPEDLICVISPSIRQCHFEVDEDVKNTFYEIFKEMEDIDEIIIPGNQTGKYNIDTVKINVNMLQEEGIPLDNIVDCNICTLCNSDIIHSYRKDKEKSGRNTAILSLK